MHYPIEAAHTGRGIGNVAAANGVFLVLRVIHNRDCGVCLIEISLINGVRDGKIKGNYEDRSDTDGEII